MSPVQPTTRTRGDGHPASNSTANAGRRAPIPGRRDHRQPRRSPRSSQRLSLSEAHPSGAHAAYHDTYSSLSYEQAQEVEMGPAFTTFQHIPDPTVSEDDRLFVPERPRDLGSPYTLPSDASSPAAFDDLDLLPSTAHENNTRFASPSAELDRSDRARANREDGRDTTGASLRGPTSRYEGSLWSQVDQRSRMVERIASFLSERQARHYQGRSSDVLSEMGIKRDQWDEFQSIASALISEAVDEQGG